MGAAGARVTGKSKVIANTERALHEHAILSRRSVLGKLSASAGAVAFGASFMRISDAVAQGTVAVRPSAHDLTVNSPETVAFDRAISAMRQNGIWDFLATYHRNFCGQPAAEIHGTWTFLPWHRLYLTIVERYVQDAAGDASLGMPYWDWYHRASIPEIYFSGALNDQTRTKGPGTTMRADEFGPGFATENTLTDEPSFSRFGGGRLNSGIIEDFPHNGGHGFVGGNMGRFGTAGLDPLFYSHHGNVDRLWEVWRQADPILPRDDPSPASGWDERTFGFVDADGTSRSWRSSETVSTEALGYRYDNDRPKFMMLASVSAQAQNPTLSLDAIMIESSAADDKEPIRLKMRPENDVRNEADTEGTVGFTLGAGGLSLSASVPDGTVLEEPDDFELLGLESDEGDGPTRTVMLSFTDLKVPTDAAYLHIHVNFDGDVAALNRSLSMAKSTFANSRVLIPFSEDPEGNPTISFDSDLTQFLTRRDLDLTTMKVLIIPFTPDGEPADAEISVRDFELKIR